MLCSQAKALVVTCSIQEDHEVYAMQCHVRNFPEKLSWFRDSTGPVLQVSMPAHRSAVRCVCVSQDDRLLATCSKGLVRTRAFLACVVVWLTRCRLEWGP